MCRNRSLCVTVTAATTAELRQKRDAVADADLDRAAARHGQRSRRRRARSRAGAGRSIVTCRPAWEGGEFNGSEEERERMLADALSLGAEYVDVEWRARFDDLDRRDRRPAHRALDRTTSTACRPTSTARAQAMRVDRRRGHQDRRAR